MVALYLHVLPDEVREKMSYIDYQDIIREIGVKLNYESICHLLGNSYAENAGEAISEASPFNVKTDKEKINSTPKPTMDMLMGLGLIK